MIKDIAKSRKAKLLNIAQQQNLDYQTLLIRYFYERLLYRLSISRFREKFCLKGGTLLYALDEKVLVDAIVATFQNRKTEIQNNHPLFSDDFAKDVNRNLRWKHFLRKIKSPDLDFSEVVTTITNRLSNMHENIHP